MSAVASEVSARLASPGAAKFSRQNLANILWAYASLKVCFPFPLLMACFCSSSIANAILGVYRCTCCYFLFPFHQRMPSFFSTQCMPGKCWASIRAAYSTAADHTMPGTPRNRTTSCALRSCALQMCVLLQELNLYLHLSMTPQCFCIALLVVAPDRQSASTRLARIHA